MQVPTPVVALATAGALLLGIYAVRDQPQPEPKVVTHTVTKTVPKIVTKTEVVKVGSKLTDDCLSTKQHIKAATASIGKAEIDIVNIEDDLEELKTALSQDDQLTALKYDKQVLASHERLRAAITTLHDQREYLDLYSKKCK